MKYGDLYSGKSILLNQRWLIGTEGALLIPHNEMPVLSPGKQSYNYSVPNIEAGNHYHSFVLRLLGAR